LLARHATKLLDTLPHGDSAAVSALVEQFINSLKPHLSPDSMQPLILDLLSSAIVKVDDLIYLRELFIDLVPVLTRVTNGDASAALLLLIEARDKKIASHHRSVEAVACRLGMALGLSGQSVQAIAASARIFDVGKLFVPCELLHGAIELNNATWEVVRQHVDDSVGIIEAIPSLRPLAGIVRSHHERFDGYGYPDRIAGEFTPIESRVIALSDAWHAMLSPRSYRTGSPVAEVVLQVADGRGRQWDPHAVDALLSLVWGDRRRFSRAS
jgi:HD-GYP domain-containing protein (c-di-GMP phosphodiesterase class II)